MTATTLVDWSPSYCRSVFVVRDTLQPAVQYNSPVFPAANCVFSQSLQDIVLSQPCHHAKACMRERSSPGSASELRQLSLWCGAGIRDHVVQAVELKFNCFFLMPVVDSFPTRLREELESAYDDDIDEVFDVTAVRNALESRLKALESELHQVASHPHIECAPVLVSRAL